MKRKIFNKLFVLITIAMIAIVAGNFILPNLKTSIVSAGETGNADVYRYSLDGYHDMEFLHNATQERYLKSHRTKASSFLNQKRAFFAFLSKNTKMFV
ncbi:MAG: hypothetical protein LBT20_00880 [Clostridiales bacterium]|jgi:hypothetical protein|nr:hypothetical protein [Clostridiales bacterium]